MKLQPGTIIRDYEVLSLLGEGGMGEVYLAREKLIGRQVAIKRLSRHLTQDPQFTERFFNEARIQSQLIHPSIVTFFSLFEHEGLYHMVLEYAPGSTLRHLIQQTGPIPEQRAIPIFRQILTALEHAHGKGIIHRDIKPSNIMIGAGDSVKVMDFGIARIVQDSHLTKTGSKLGTPAYMSPEQVRARKDIDHRSDIFSAGIVFYEMLTGRLPYLCNTESDYEIMDEIVRKPLPDPREVYQFISDASVDLLPRVCAKDREQRPSSREVIAAIDGKPMHSILDSTIKHQILESQTSSVQSSIRTGNMIFIEGGSYMMGSNEGYDDEKPVHKVKLNSFYVGKCEVTQMEWVAVMGSNPSRWKGDNLPVESVSWYDAIAYCNKLSITEGLSPCYSIGVNTIPADWSEGTIDIDWSADGYRLPTEAEWEYAARGGNQSKGYQYSGSNDIGKVAWYLGNSGRKTLTVGTKQANELGIHDMSGNVWEWCWDWYGSGYYTHSPASDPTGPASGSSRVLRGGSWNHLAGRCRVADRHDDFPDSWFIFYGLRILRAIK